jgi:hypothetical protein
LFLQILSKIKMAETSKPISLKPCTIQKIIVLNENNFGKINVRQIFNFYRTIFDYIKENFLRFSSNREIENILLFLQRLTNHYY